MLSLSLSLLFLNGLLIAKTISKLQRGVVSMKFQTKRQKNIHHILLNYNLYFSILASLALLIIGSFVLYQRSQERAIKRVYFNDRIILTNLEMTLSEYANSAIFLLDTIEHNIIDKDFIDLYLKDSYNHLSFIDQLFLLDHDHVITHSYPYKKDLIGLSMEGKIESNKRNDVVHWSGIETKLLNNSNTIRLLVQGEAYSIIVYANHDAIENLITLSSEPDTYITIRDLNKRLIVSNLDSEPQYIKSTEHPVFFNADRSIYEKRLNKTDYLFTHTELNNISWTVEIGTNKNIILQDIKSWAFTIIVLTICIFIIFWFVLRRNMFTITNEFDHLIRTTSLVSEGTYVIPDHDESDITEFALLNQQFKIMTQTIKSRNDSIQEFAYLASHDLQEPLRMIQSFIHILKIEYSHLFDPKGLEYFQYVEDGASRLSSLIKGILVYSRASDQYKINEEVDLNNILNIVEKQLALFLKENHTKINVSALPIVKGNVNMVIQVIQNFVQNAIKYKHPERNPEISIYCTEDSSNYYLHFEDNGIGIKEENLEIIFDMFKRIHTRKEHEGNGIGLALVRRIVEMHQWRIKLESTYESGSDFILIIPIRRGD